MKKEITLSFVIPFYNEEKRIYKTIKTLLKGYSFNGIKLQEIIFINDGSTDKTLERIQNYKEKIEKTLRAKVKIISYPKNKGKGYAVKKGMLKSQSDYTLFFDVDMSTPLFELKKFIPYMQNNTPVIIGTRKNGKSTVIKHQPFYREMMGKFFTFLTNTILGTKVTDFTCGFKAFSKEAAEKIFSQSKINRWAYDAEIIYLAKKMNLKIQEVAVVWANDSNTKVKIIKDAFQTFIDIIKIKFGHYNYSVNYKKALSYA